MSSSSISVAIRPPALILGAPLLAGGRILFAARRT